MAIRLPQAPRSSSTNRLAVLVPTRYGRIVFTGIVEQLGILRARTARGPGARLTIECRFPELQHGESIAVAGVCLTVAAFGASGFEADVSAETLARSTLGHLPLGSAVDLERALTPQGRLGGHFVSGHVDAMGRLLERVPLGAAFRLRFSLPRELLPYVAVKGSIAIDGVSLTVSQVSPLDVSEGWFEVVLIPVSLAETTLSRLRAGEAVNLEVDVLARYLARLLAAGAAGLSLAEPTDPSGASSRAASAATVSDAAVSTDASLLSALHRAGWT